MRRLLIFLKHPMPGQVKTRLASAIGPEAAAAVYRVCVELTLDRLQAFASEATVCVEPAAACHEVRVWLGPQWHIHPQTGQTLGERLSDAMDEAFQDGARWVVCIGTDSPWLTASEVQDAFTALGRSDVVVGPAEDGGYYLIGLSRPAPTVFQDIAWSTSSVYEQTLAKAHALKLSVQVLEEGYDVDRLEDVRRFITEESARGSRAAWLETIAALCHEQVTTDVLGNPIRGGCHA